MNELEKCAQILVECGYAKSMFEEDGDWYVDHWEVCPFYSAKNETNADLMNECVARRQADAIEDWLNANQSGLWCVFSRKEKPIKYNLHQWRIDRIKWAINEIIKNDEG